MSALRNRREVHYILEEKHKKEESMEEHLKRRSRREHRIKQEHLKRRKRALKKEKKSIE